VARLSEVVASRFKANIEKIVPISEMIGQPGIRHIKTIRCAQQQGRLLESDRQW
jgi:hypothetical protein